MRQLAGQPVQVIGNHGMHQTLVDQITELGELWAVERRARIVIDKDMALGTV